MATATHEPEHASHHNGKALTLYLVVGVALAIFTGTSFWVYEEVHSGKLAENTGFFIILGVAVVKAILVAAIFMHLMFDWKRVYFMIIPALILGTLMIVV